MTDLRQCESDFARALHRLERYTKFADILAETSEGRTVSADSKSTTPTPRPRLSGAVLRAWGGGRWVEVATSALDGPSIARAAESLGDQLAKAGSGPDPPGTPSSMRREWSQRPSKPMRDLSLEEVTRRVHEALGWAKEVDGIRECQARIMWGDEERFYVSSAGARCYQLLPRVLTALAAIAMESGRVELDFLSDGGLGGSERLEALNPERVRETGRNAVELLHASTPPAGEMAVILDPSTSGTFAHESFGHGTEADQFVRERSYLKPLLGTTLGPELLTIADDGSFPNAWGTIYVDDEGNPGRKTVLVDHGRFVSALYDIESATRLKARPTGNARRADFLSRLFVRMTNTYVEPGDWTLEELVREAKNGVLLERATSGIEDPQGGQMQLKVKKGRRIENGKLTDRVTSMALSGKVLDFLKATRGVSRASDFKVDPGFCGKGHTDLLPVASGGPYLLSTAIVGPA